MSELKDHVDSGQVTAGGAESQWSGDNWGKAEHVFTQSGLLSGYPTCRHR